MATAHRRQRLRQAGLSLRGQSRDTLVLCSLPDGPFSQSIRDVMERMATVLWPWRRVVMLDDAVKWWTLDDVRGAIESLRARLDEREPDELWMVSVPNIPAKIRAEAYPSAQIVFFEDGLHTYLPVVDHYITAARFLTEPRHVYHALKVRIRERLRPNDLSICQLLPRHRARVIANYTWISLVVPPPDYQTRFRSTQIQTSHVRETLELVTPMLDDVKFEFAAKPRAVLLDSASPITAPSAGRPSWSSTSAWRENCKKRVTRFSGRSTHERGACSCQT